MLRLYIGKVTLTYDELAAVLTEVKAIRNSRPISYLSSEDIEEPLPPSHLLTGHCLLTLPDLTNHERDPTFGDRDPNIDLTRRMQLLAQTLEHFLSRWKTDYLMELRWPGRSPLERKTILKLSSERKTILKLSSERKTILKLSSERKAQSARRRAQGAERKAQSAERRAQSAERRAQSAERRAQSAERRAQSAERKAQSAERKALYGMA